MVADHPFRVDTELLALVLGFRRTERTDEGAARRRDADGGTQHRAAGDRPTDFTVVFGDDAAGGDAVVGTAGLALAVQGRQGEVVGQVAGVLQRPAGAAVLIERGTEQTGALQGRADRQVGRGRGQRRVWILITARGAVVAVAGVRSGTVERAAVRCAQCRHGVGIDVGLLLDLVGERGQFQRVAVVDVPVHLQQPGRRALRQRGADVAEDVAVGVGTVDPAIAQQGIGEQVILDQGATGPDRGRRHRAGGVLAVVRNMATPVRIARIVVVNVGVLAVERIRRIEDVAARVEIVGTALGHDVDHAAGHATEFGAVTAGLHLLFGDRFEGHLPEVEVAERVGDVEAVDEVAVLGHRAATEGGQVAERRVAAHRARRQQGDVGDVARDRDLGDLLGRQDRGRFDRRNVDGVDGAGADDFDGAQIGRLTDADLDRARFAAGGDLVVADRQVADAVAAIGVGGDFTAEAGGIVFDDDRCAGRGRAGDVAGRVRLRVGAAGEAKSERERQPALAQALVFDCPVHLSCLLPSRYRCGRGTGRTCAG